MTRFPNTGTRSWKVVPVVGRYAQSPEVGGLHEWAATRAPGRPA